ncbi:MAG: TRAP transporter substrate-binding protein [Desulfobacterota bacterium]|nr:TRAP transporter substrate-binding protein [Thermodesulfobacteriota bacterium]MDW8001639.1 TRAP transporter substrate-binding protein [Deltaproteobacteria bacterium]
MRKLSYALLVGLMFLFLADSVLCAPAIELKWANYFPVVARQSKICEEFIKDIEARTGGKVKFSYFPAGTLLSPAKMYDGVVQGIADIGFSHIAYTPGRFKVTEVLDMPLGFPNAWVSNHVVNDFFKRFRPKEWDDVHVLTLHSSPINVMMVATKPVYKLEDLKGLNIRAMGYIADVVSALGATPRGVAAPETYDAILKRVVDGVYIPMETFRAFRFAEVIKYTTECWGIGQQYNFYIVMNKDTWRKLPDDVKKVFNEYPFQEKLATMWNEIDIDGKQLGMEKGIQFITLSPEEEKRWIKAAETVIDKYIKSMVAAGYSERDVRGWISFVKERIDYWLKKQRELKIKSTTGPDDVRIK